MDISQVDFEQSRRKLFDELWRNYPTFSIIHSVKGSNKDIFSNHCAINLSHTLYKSGIRTGGTKCWNCEFGGIHTIRAEELARFLKINSILGISAPKFLTGKNFELYIGGKQGIVFLKDYWQRNSDRNGSRTGDHIDLWNKNSLGSLGWFFTWTRRTFPSFSESYLDMSDLRKSKEVIFWEIK